MIEAIALLLTALLFGGMVLFSAGFAGVLFRTLPPETAGQVLRRTFPGFYLFVIVAAIAAALPLWFSDPAGAVGLAIVAVTTVPARQVLMPAINRATDAGRSSRFKVLHGASVALTLAHIVIAGWVVTRFLG